MDALTRPSANPPPPRRPNPPARYPDLHDHVRALDKAGLLIRVTRPINKDTEMHPLVRWQFRGGIEEKDRKAFLFENVTDSKGRKYDIPVLVGGLAANREIYRIGLGCEFSEIDARWVEAAAHPLPPKIVTNAPCHDIVITGAALDKPGQGLDGIPLPISTPGWDVAPYATLSQYITKDPDTGIQNMGNYRGQVKARRRLGMNPSLELRPGIYNHWEKLRARGFKKLPCAVVLGAPPCITFASVQKLPETLDELHVAGALVGAPINVVKAKTVDLLVPAEAEIVIEGFIDTEFLEPEAPFGEMPRPRQSAGVQRLHGRHRHHPAEGRDPDLDHLAGDAVGIEPDQARRHGAAVLELPEEHARHQGRQAGVDARAADQHPQGHRARLRTRHAHQRSVAGDVWRGDPAPRRRQVRHRRQRRHRPDQRRRAVVGDVVPRQPKPRHARAAAPRPGPRPALAAQRRRRTPRC